MMLALFALTATVLLALYLARHDALPAVTLAGPGRAAAPDVTTDTTPQVDDPQVAASAMFHAMLTLEGASASLQRNVRKQISQAFSVDDAEARELALLGAWVADQYDSPLEAVPALSNRLRQLGGPKPAAQIRMARAIFGARLPTSVAAALPRA
ncbi:hypothetical protein ACW9UR_07205 [Halovulum sp. GXIMD14794]